MGKPTVRFGGGVWKHQEDVRADMQRRLDESDDKLQHANAEVNRVHAQCVLLLREKNELTVSLNEAHTQLRRQGDELHAAKQNVAELMTLLTQANEARTKLEKERNSVTALWHQARDQEQLVRRDVDALRRHCEEDEQEAKRLRDLLYETQEQNECQHLELARFKRHLQVAAHSNEAKDRQVLALIRERDLFAQKLAHYRSRFTEGKPLPATHKTQKPQPQQCGAANELEDSCANVTWTEVSPEREEDEAELPTAASSSTLPFPNPNMLEFERQKQKLRDIALQTKVRLEKERLQNATLLKRIEALEKSQQELLVRYREASRARRKRVAGIASPVVVKPVVVPSESPRKETDSSVQAA